MKLKATAVLLASAISFSAQADSNWGVSYSQLNISDEGFDVKPSALMVSYEAPMTENLDWQVRLGTGISDDSFSVIGLEFSTEVNYVYGAYATYNFTTESNFKPYAMLGYTGASLDVSFAGMSDDGSESGFSYGAGFDYNVSDSSAVNFEFAQLFSDTTAISLGYKFNF